MFQNFDIPDSIINLFDFSFLLKKVILTSFMIILVCTNALTQAALQSISQYEGKEQGQWFAMENTDRARYSPGDTVTFNITFRNRVEDKNLYVRYRRLNQTIDELVITLSSTNSHSWTWHPPEEDYKGYLVEIFLKSDDEVLDHTNIAVDVSSSWSKFPRYGFLSKFNYMSAANIEAVISRLNRYHINGLQFYDWHHKHHKPLKGTPENPASSWNDIANRINYFSTVKGYIEEAHKYNMKTMAYNLLYGAWNDAHLDGVLSMWRLFKDPNHQNPWLLSLPSGWASDLYIMDPSNQLWKDYIFTQTEKVFRALPFDGWHVDQVGDWGRMYNYQGDGVSVNKTFKPFLDEAKVKLNVHLLMNAVNQYGQPEIAVSPVDFLYTEVWDPNKTYANLVSIINKNSTFSKGNLNTVLAAYLNYDLSESPGMFNTPGVLFADAVIFAAGGAHLELGEHTLCHEYFPNNNLNMSKELEQQLIHYYDFLVAYENLLRDSVMTSNIQVNSSGSVIIKSWQQSGTVWAFVKEKKHRQILHLINFTNAVTLNWRDKNGTQAEPDTLQSIKLWFNVEHDQQVSAIWTASPDFYQGSSVEIPFTLENERVSFTVPKLKYWDMVVIEYTETNSSIENSEKKSSIGFLLEQNFPNPFNPITVIPFRMQQSSIASLKVFDILGRQIYKNDIYCNQGLNKFVFNGSGLSSGIYIYSLGIKNFNKTKEMILMK